MTLTREQAEFNKQERERAEQYLLMLGDENLSLRCWKELVRLIVEQKLVPAGELSGTEKTVVETMSYDVAKHWSYTTLPDWSQYAGNMIREVPKGYLIKLAGKDKWSRELAQYVASEYFQALPE